MLQLVKVELILMTLDTAGTLTCNNTSSFISLLYFVLLIRILLKLLLECSAVKSTIFPSEMWWSRRRT